ncbi:DEAD/DEAH box helicase [Salmonella enterica subsp. enterica serovar Vinohrady]|nr:DEAD/DEAH box helicase [Salmonella enterica subsp. enterica serovar Vinohrady]
MNKKDIVKEIPLAQRLSMDAYASKYFKEICNYISYLYDDYLFNNIEFQTLRTIDTKKIEQALRFADILSHSNIETHRTKSFEIISKIAAFHSNDHYFKMIGSAVINRLGIFAADKLISQGVHLPLDREIESSIKKSFQRTSIDGLFFTDKQYDLYQSLINSNTLSFAGPTSMGKSFVINEYIKNIVFSNTKKNIVLIVPTRALISQGTLKLKNELRNEIDNDQYKIVTTSYMLRGGTDHSKGYIFVLTPERLVSLISSSPDIIIDYIFVDEAQKLTIKNDTRSLVTYSAIEQTLNLNPTAKLFFSSPNLSNPEVFNDLFNREQAEVYRSIEGATAQNLYFIDLLNNKFSYINKGELIDINNIYQEYKSANDLIFNINKGKSKIIYTGGIDSTLSRTRDFLRYIKKARIKKKPQNYDLASQVREFVHNGYELAEAIEYGVAFHFGNLPQAIRDLIEHHFKIGNIDYLFCTSTLLEGVNLPARSVFILTSKKGTKYFEPVDFWNLAGRAGRLAIELAGDIFCIKDDSGTWNDKAVKNLILSDKNEIELTPSFYINDPKRIKELEQIITTGSTEGIKNGEFLRTLGDMVRIDTLRTDKTNNLPLIKYFRNNGNNDILYHALKSIGDIKIPTHVLLANCHIAINSQHNAFNSIRNYSIDELRLSWNPTNDEIKEKLALIFNIYQIDKYSKGLDRLNSKSISYYAVILSKWMHGNTLSEIIADTIIYYISNKKNIYLSNKVQELFDQNNPIHITKLVNDTIKDIELKVGYQLQNYISHYCQLLSLTFENNPGANWSQFIEFGSNDPIIWQLQFMGFSRHCAIFLKKNFPKYLKYDQDNNKLYILNKAEIKSKVKQNKLYWLEIQALL